MPNISMIPVRAKMTDDPGPCYYATLTQKDSVADWSWEVGHKDYVEGNGKVIIKFKKDLGITDRDNDFNHCVSEKFAISLVEAYKAGKRTTKELTQLL